LRRDVVAVQQVLRRILQLVNKGRIPVAAVQVIHAIQGVRKVGRKAFNLVIVKPAHRAASRTFRAYAAPPRTCPRRRETATFLLAARLYEPCLETGSPFTSVTIGRSGFGNPNRSQSRPTCRP